jgi:hypothetical protein
MGARARKFRDSGKAEGSAGDKRRRSPGQNTPDAPHPTAVADGGKWAGSGKKTVTRNSVRRGKAPEIAQQPSTGRGSKTRMVTRTDTKRHRVSG